MRGTPNVRAIGHAAHAALVASGGRIDADTSEVGSYARASGEVVWIGHGNVIMHPRAVVLAHPARVHAHDCLDITTLTPWRPPPMPLADHLRGILRAGCAALARNLVRLPPPAGLAALLVAQTPQFPLDRAEPLVRAFALALDHDDAASIVATGLPLLGLGPGLTPSGDDLVGGALFARRLLAATARERDAETALATNLIDAARERTHPVAVALFADLATAQTFAPLHRLAHAMAVRAGADVLVDAAHALVVVGRSSGFEMLAGFMLGVAGAAMLPQ
jgi:uncharacterized protein DUF2877